MERRNTEPDDIGLATRAEIPPEHTTDVERGAALAQPRPLTLWTVEEDGGSARCCVRDHAGDIVAAEFASRAVAALLVAGPELLALCERILARAPLAIKSLDGCCIPVTYAEIQALEAVVGRVRATA